MMKVKKKHKNLNKIQRRNIRRKIKQSLGKRQTKPSDYSDEDNSENKHTWESGDSEDHSETSGCHSRDWEHTMQKIILNNKNVFHGLKSHPKPNDKRLNHKKHKKLVKKHVKKHKREGEGSNTVASIAHESRSISKTHPVGEVRGSVEAPWQLYYDGASVKSQKYAGSGAVLQNLKHHTLDEFARFIGPQTMPVAEYVGLLGGLRLALNWNVDHLCCYGDSRVVHNQVKGLWKTRTFKMAFLCFHAQELLKLFRSVKFVFIRRRKNLHAARLAHEAICVFMDREAEAKSACQENKQKKKSNEAKRDDDDRTDFDDEYYEYK